MAKENDKNDNKKIIPRELAAYLGLGIQLAATVTIFVFIGIWLDKKLDSSPWATIICSFIGVITGMYHFIKTVIQSGK
jgi:F0F1-type ATP synthase assembly protein I